MQILNNFLICIWSKSIIHHNTQVITQQKLKPTELFSMDIENKIFDFYAVPSYPLFTIGWVTHQTDIEK